MGFHCPDELSAEVREAGFRLEGLHAVEGPGAFIDALREHVTDWYDTDSCRKETQLSNTAFYKARREAELPAFRKVLEAMPRERFDYRPHERSPAARDIAWTLTMETKACCAFIDEGRVDWQHVDPPDEPSAIIEAFEQSYRELDERVASLDNEAWSKPVGIYANGKLMRERPLGEFLWFMFFDAIHHRGQLSTYIRPMGGKVPAIYGPSGDDPGR